jgi:hypothetical protein
MHASFSATTNYGSSSVTASNFIMIADATTIGEVGAIDAVTDLVGRISKTDDAFD